MLHRNGEKIELRDMKALSGTYLMNGTRLKPDETVELENGETFYLSSPSNAISVVLGSRENAKEIKDYKYVCSACGRRRTGWYQKCPDCGSVGTITLYEENRIQELYGCPNVKELERYELLKTVEVVDYARRDSAT